MYYFFRVSGLKYNFVENIELVLRETHGMDCECTAERSNWVRLDRIENIGDRRWGLWWLWRLIHRYPFAPRLRQRKLHRFNLFYSQSCNQKAGTRKAFTSGVQVDETGNSHDGLGDLVHFSPFAWFDLQTIKSALIVLYLQFNQRQLKTFNKKIKINFVLLRVSIINFN